MNKKTDAILSVIAIVLIVIAVWGLFIYPADEAREIKDKLGKDFTFKVQCEVCQMDNASAVLYSTIELPKNFSNEDNLVEAKIGSVKSSFDRSSDSAFHSENDNLYLGTRDDLLFVQNGSRLENYLIVPSGERLTVAIEIRIPIYSWFNYMLENITIEVVT